jgi:hypothetical protein
MLQSMTSALFARMLFVAGILLLALGGWLYYDALPEPPSESCLEVDRY